jgi:hypothetical protein
MSNRIIGILLLPDLGFLVELNVDPRRLFYLGYAGMFIVFYILFIFNILRAKLKHFRLLQGA